MVNKEAIRYQRIKQATLLIFPSPTLSLDKEELSSVKSYLEEGGNLILLGNEGWGKDIDNGFNELLGVAGISFLGNSVIKTNFFRYNHPKEALISNGLFYEGQAEEMRTGAGRVLSKIDFRDLDDNEDEGNNFGGMSVVFPFGSSLSVNEPAISIFHSGTSCYPIGSPLIALSKIGRGRMAVIGSWKIAEDHYYDKEDNSILLNSIIQALTQEKIWKIISTSIKKISNKNPPQPILPNIESLSERLKPCIDETMDISTSFLNHFQTKLYESNFEHLPESLDLYKKLNVPCQPLKFITPSFETPMLGMTPSVFPPVLADLESPALELYDLDDEFADFE